MWLIIDLHVHSKPKSPCSSMTPQQIIEEARRIGLDGICFVEHDVLWTDEEITALRKESGFLVLKGYEISALDGHFLAFGYKKVVEPFLELSEIRKFHDSQRGFLVIAHPFREFLVVGVNEIGLSVEAEANKPVFKLVDGIEVINGRVSKKANKFAKQVNSIVRLKELGGSDAHELYEIGKVVTEFNSASITNEADLVRELKTGNYTVKYFREE
jgi:predicted metal-dependent phosphoesterase TrpH